MGCTPKTILLFFLATMAINVRGLIDYDLASHFYDIATKKGKFNYFIDSKAQWKFNNEPNPIKMTSQDLAYTQSVIDGIGQMTSLKPKKTSNVNKSTFVIQKTNDFTGGLLGYMRPTGWGNYLVLLTTLITIN